MIEAANKTCDLIMALAGHEVTGLRNNQISDRMKVSPATVTQYLKTLEHKGLVEPVPGHANHWRLGPKFVQIAIAHQLHISHLRQRVDEVHQRYSRQP